MWKNKKYGIRGTILGQYSSILGSGRRKERVPLSPKLSQHKPRLEEGLSAYRTWTWMDVHLRIVLKYYNVGSEWPMSVQKAIEDLCSDHAGRISVVIDTEYKKTFSIVQMYDQSLVS